MNFLIFLNSRGPGSKFQISSGGGADLWSGAPPGSYASVYNVYRVDAINYKAEKSINRGYKLHEVLVEKMRALSLDSRTILHLDGIVDNVSPSTNSED